MPAAVLQAVAQSVEVEKRKVEEPKQEEAKADEKKEEPKVEPKIEEASVREVNEEAKMEPKAGQASAEEVKVEAKVETQVEPKEEPQVEAKAEVKVEPRVETEKEEEDKSPAEGKPEPETTPKPKPKLEKIKKSPAPPPERTAASSREKRTRKTSATFEPEDFTKVDRSATIVDGRGTKLGDIQVIRDAIESAANVRSHIAHELDEAHKLMFKTRGKPARKDMVHNILEFNGYLPKEVEGITKEEQEKLDKEVEVSVAAGLIEHLYSPFDSFNRFTHKLTITRFNYL